MSAQDPSFDRLLEAVERHESKTRRAAILWTVIPASLALLLLGYSSWRLETASRQVAVFETKVEEAGQELVARTGQLEEMRVEATAMTEELHARRDEAAALARELDEHSRQNDKLREETEVLRRQLEETQQLLAQTLELSQYRFDVNPVDVKTIFSRFPREAEILDFMIQMRERGVGWHLGGQTPEQGFDSPGFAEYVLRHFGLSGGSVTAGQPLLVASRRLYDTLPKVTSPQVGDLVFYPSGYVLFYFRNHRNEPFVIGMTPFGIAAFKEDFAAAVGYRRPRAR